LIIAAAMAMVTALPAHAVIVSYTVDGTAAQQFAAPTTPPVDAPWGLNGYPGDTVQLLSYAGSLDLAPGTTIQQINTLLWTIDYTYGGTATDPNQWSDITFNFNVIRNMTSGGVGPASLDQIASLVCGWEDDTLTVNGSSTVTFYVQGYRVDVTPFAVGPTDGSNFDGNNPWVQPSQEMMAQFAVSAVPEPTTMVAGALLLLPFGMSTLRLLRRKQTA